MKKLCLTLTVFALALAACAAPTPAPTPTPTPDEWLDRAAQAVSALKSAQFSLVREGPPVVLDPQTGVAFTEATGQYQAPDRVSASTKVSLGGTVLQIKWLWLPEGNFVTNPLTQAWTPTPAGAAFNGAALFGPEGFAGALKDGLQNTKLVGVEKIEEAEALRISGEADGAKLAALTAGALDAGTAYPVDVWLQPATADVIRLHIAEPDGNGWLIDLFDLNAPVEIKAP